MSGKPVIHGRDFIAYRIGGAVAALLLLLALAWQVYEIFDGDARTVPEQRWSMAARNGQIAAPEGETNAILVEQVLRDRTRLQDERYRTGPSPEAPDTGMALERGDLMVNRAMKDGAKLTESWSQVSSETNALIRSSRRVVGLSSLPYANAGVFERPVARDWRWAMADLATHLGALAILGMSFLLALMLAIRGRVPIAEGRSGIRVRRFGSIERATHWMTSTSFIILALTGLVIAYGDTLFYPFGEAFMGQVGWIATWTHSAVLPPFALGIIIMAAKWTRRNLPSRLDIPWLARAGGFFSDSGDNPPARKFNAGQKLVFWSAILGGGAMVVSGVALMFPYFFLDLDGMSWAMLIHAVLATLLIAIFIGHIYIGTVGMQGAFWAMWLGTVDRNWAKEHHELWLAEIEQNDKTSDSIEERPR